MNKFGWSYPPGVSRLPWDDAQNNCEICLGYPEAGDDSPSRCICPVCDICGSAGDPACYATKTRVNHGLEVSHIHRPLIEERKFKLAQEHEAERLADLQLAEYEQNMQREWELQQNS